MAEQEKVQAEEAPFKKLDISTASQFPQQSSVTTLSVPDPSSSKQTVVGSASSVTGFQLKPQIISTPFGLRLANNTVAVPIQQSISQTGKLTGTNPGANSGLPQQITHTISSNQPATFQPGTTNAKFSHSIPMPSTVVRQPINIQHLPVKGQQVSIQRLPAGSVVSIANGQIVGMHQQPTRAAGRVQSPRIVSQVGGHARQSLGSTAIGQKISKTPAATLVNVSQTGQVGLKLTNQSQQQVNIQRLINPPINQQSQQAVIQRISNGNVLSGGVVRAAATILSGQQISLKSGPSGTTFLKGSPTSGVTLTVTSVSSNPVVSSTTPLSVASSNNRQGFTLNQGQVLSQGQVLRPGLPIVLNLPGGQQQVIQGSVSQMSTFVQNNFNSAASRSVPISQVIASSIRSQTMPRTCQNTTLKAVNQSGVIVSTVASAVSTVTSITSKDLKQIPLLISMPKSINSTPNTTKSKGAESSLVLSISPTTTSQSVSSQVALSSHTSTTNCSTSVCVTTASETACQTKPQPMAASDVSKPQLVASESSRSPPTNANLKRNNEPESQKVSVEDSNTKTTTEKKEDCSTPKCSTTALEDKKQNFITVGKNGETATTNAENTMETKHEIDPKDGTVLTEGYIDSDLLQWDNGTGTLPGTDMKFKINEFGDLELVDDVKTAAEQRMTLEQRTTSDTSDVIKRPVVEKGIEQSVKNDSHSSKETNALSVANPVELSEREGDPVCCCSYCGRYGYKSTFKANGRFCSQTCAGKKNVHRKQLIMSQMMLGMKSKKKKLYMKDDLKSVVKDDAKYGEVEKSLNHFDWDNYLADTETVGAPRRLFKEPYPSGRNGFKLGMRLEGIDPKHQSLLCVLSVAEVQGYRLRLHFDGYSECYDFWLNADSPFIFPVGFAEKNGKDLQPPKNLQIEQFNWLTYLKQIGAVAAPKHIFLNQPVVVTPSAFRIGMKLEAIDKKNWNLICVATVANSLGEKILVHFDGWDHIYDYWCDVTAPAIHPVGWCKENNYTLSAPPGWEKEEFVWEDYLSSTNSTPVPARAFKTRGPIGFEVGMKLEVVDRRNPILIRVASVAEVHNFRLLIHFDGWPSAYDYWLEEDCVDIHPPHWCWKTFHALQIPINKEKQGAVVAGGCPTFGCKGIGHIKGAKYTGHHSKFGCPYSDVNMSKDTWLTDRLGSTRSEENAGLLLKQDSSGEFKGNNSRFLKCPTPGCDGLGHVTGKFTSHHCVSGCPQAEKNLLKVKSENVPSRPVGRPVRGGRGGRKRKFMNHHSDVGGKFIKTESMYGDDPENQLLQASVHESVFLSTVDPLYQEQPLYWEQQAKLLPGVEAVSRVSVASWSVEEVAGFIQELTGREEQAQKFRDQEIDGDSFLLLQQSDLMNFLDIKLGPAVKIFNSILVFRRSPS